VWDLFLDERSRHAVEVAERFADGQAGDTELSSARSRAWSAYGNGESSRQEAATATGRRPHDFALAGYAACWVAHPDVNESVTHAFSSVGWVRYSASDPDHIWQPCDILRESFVNPVRPPAVKARWRTADVLALAESAYEARRLPSGRLESEGLCVLADALEEAGCDEGRILEHLRSTSPHIRGCWALDLVLGK
jgi:hypothetical protein